jgi:two-component system, LytTR family, response regulator
MNKLNCLIVDDEELARTLLENYISRLSHLEIVGKCVNPIEALETLQTNSIDILFLDIQMPEMLGTDFLKTLSHKPMVIFTTAYSEYAVESYDLDAVDYLVKPFSFERFIQAVNKACDLYKLKHIKQNYNNIEIDKTRDKKNYILVKSEHKVHRLALNDILYIQSLNEYVAYYTNDGKILSLGSLKSLEASLPQQEFIRVHKSYIVSKAKVATLEGNMVHIGSIKIPIGESYKKRVLKEIF